MKKSRILMLSALCFLTIQALSAEVTARLIGENHTRLEKEPLIRHGLLIGNTGPEAVDVQFSFDLPEGFSLLLEPGLQRIESRSEKIVLFALHLSGDIRAGTWEYSYRVLSQPVGSDTTEFITEKITVEVPPRPSMKLSITGVPPFVPAGNSYAAGLQLANRGNVPLQIELVSKSSDGSSIVLEDFEENMILLLPGETKETPMKVTTDKDISRPVKDRIELVAVSSRHGLKERDAAVVEIIPPVSDNIDPYYRKSFYASFDTEFEFTADGEMQPIIQATASTFGFLDYNKRHYLEIALGKQLDLNTVSFSEASTFLDPTDSLSLKYTGRFGRLGLGDLSRSVTPLLQQSSFGRGADLRINIGPVFAGGLYQLPTVAGTVTESAGGFLGFETNSATSEGEPLYSAQATYFIPLSGSGLFSLLQNIRTRSEDYLSLEAAFGQDLLPTIGKSTFSLDDAALEGKIGFTIPRFKLTASGFFAGPAFSGTRQDGYLFNGEMTLKPFGPALSLGANGGIAAYNRTGAIPDEDTREMIEFGGGVGLNLGRFTVSGNYQHRKYSGLSSDGGKIIDVVYDGGRVNFNLLLNKFSLGLKSELGRNYLGAVDTVTIAQEYSLSAQVEPSESLSFSIDASYFRKMYGIDIPDNQFSAKAGSSFSTNSFILFGSSTVTSPSFDFKNLMISSQLSLSFITKRKNILEFSASHTAAGINGPEDDAHDFSLRLSYTHSFSVRGARKADFGGLEGIVLDDFNKPVEGMLLRLDDYAAVTADDGTFLFPALPPGRYQLDIDQGSLDPAVRPLREMPLFVEIRSEETQNMEISLIRSASLKGRIEKYSFLSPYAAIQSVMDENVPEKETYSSAPVPFEKVLLTNGSVTYWTETDSSGRFSFDDLTPGRWTYTVPALQAEGSIRVVFSRGNGGNIDDGQAADTIERDILPVHIGEGDSLELKLKHFPPAPKVRVLEETEKLSIGR